MTAPMVASTALLSTALLLGAACAPTASTGSAHSRALPDHITRSEIEGIVAENAFDVIERLRPQWLQVRGPSSVTQPEGDWPLVYLDNVPAGDVNVLTTIPVGDIGQIRFISPSDATTRWGTGVAGGVIQITSLKRIK